VQLTPQAGKAAGRSRSAKSASAGKVGGRGGTSAGAPKGASKSVPTGVAAKARRRAHFFNVEALPAGHGDCLWIEYGAAATTHRLLIDCGTQATSRALLDRVDAVPENERFLELFVLSHIDSDHIGGALPFFRAVKRGLRIGDVWFNGWRHISGQLGARQGEMFSTAIQDFELPWNAWRGGRTIMVDGDDLPEHVLPGGMKLTLLSPTRAQLDTLRPVWTRELKRYGLEPGARVDYSRFLRGTPSTTADATALADIEGLAATAFGGDNGAPNGTSIAVLAEFGGASALFAADAHAPVLAGSIAKLLAKRKAAHLKLDLFKVSHHGSQNNVSSELIRLLDCPRYLISTNGDHFYHPDRQAIARILKYGGDRKTLYFNYNNRLNDVWGDAALEAVRTKYRCETSYPPPDRPGVIVPLL
jgi:beta-lactamase superfamily II metal-dependent hydrolase